MKLKYTGRAHERSFLKSDFTGVGLENGAAVKFNAGNNYVAEVDDEVGAWLLEVESDAFREATREDETEEDLTRASAAPRGMRAAFAESSGDESSESVRTRLGAGGTTSGATAGRRRGSTASK